MAKTIDNWREPVPAAGEPWAWCVIARDGFRAVFIDRAQADRYAAASHGVLVPLYPADSPEP